ncbi:MAG: hypothetical protein Q4D89_10760 [Arachnia propionica]|uniref:hypothetical protein n=1 Tax=Arachnia propionica TaxID=1750 RepID=UPI0027038E27|nr:hypothetical protein [Arachnia propionica]
MGKFSTFVKATTPVVVTTVALLKEFRENPELRRGIDAAIAKFKKAASPKERVEARVNAIDVAADAVAEIEAEATEPAMWRRQAQALRMRSDLAWHGNTGAARRKALKALDTETAELLAAVNEHLVRLQADAAPPSITP